MADADPTEAGSPSSASQPAYPEPMRTPNPVYPALNRHHGGSKDAPEVEPYSSPYGLFPGSRGNSTYLLPDSPHMPPARRSTVTQKYDHAVWGGAPRPTSSRHHVTDFSAFETGQYSFQIPSSAPRSTDYGPYGPWGGFAHTDPNDGRLLGYERSNTHSTRDNTYYDDGFDPRNPDQVERLIRASDLHEDSQSIRGSKIKKRRGGWRQVLKGTEHEKVGTAADRGDRRPRGSGRAGRKAKAIDPGSDFRENMSKASKSFFDGNLNSAADFAREAVKINPEVFQAHSLLSEILKAQGRDEDSLEALRLGAVTIRNTDVWRLVAEKTLEVDDEERTLERLKVAIECYGEAIKLCKDPEVEYELRVAKLSLYMETKNTKFARLDCKNILKQWPGKSQYVKEYAQLTAGLQDSGELQKSLDAYDAVFEIYKDEDAFGDEEDDNDPWDHLNIYLELIYHCGDPKDGLAKAKRYARWFIGRKDETFWDRYIDDDREWDCENDRRAYVGEFQQGKASRDREKYGDGLPIDIRVRMGLFRMKLNMQEEAFKHFEPLLQYVKDVDDYHDMFWQTVTSLRHAGCMQQAAPYFDALRNVSQVTILDQKMWMQLGTCYMSLQRPQDAIQCFEAVISLYDALHGTPQRGQHYTSINGYAKAGALLAKLYEDEGEIDKARFMCNDLIRLGRRELLSDAKVKMIPENTKYAFTPGTSDLDPQQPKSKYRRKTSEQALQPDGEPQLDDDGNPVGPQKTRKRKPSKSKDDNGNGAADPSSQTADGSAPRKRKRPYKRNIVEANAGDEDAAESSKDGGAPTIKRPRLSRPRTKMSEKAANRYREIQDAEARCLTNYAVVQAHWKSFEEASDEDSLEQWIGAASSMMEDFLSMRVFFPSRDRNIPVKLSEDPTKGLVKDMHHSDNREAEQFLSIPFTQWNRMFISLAIHYSKTGEQDKCYKILQDVLWGANVFYLDRDLRRVNYATSLSCALAFNDSQYWIELARKVITDSDYASAEAFQLLASLNRFSTGSNWFSSGPTQKFILRMVKHYDYLAMSPELRGLFDWSIQGPSLAVKAAKEDNGPRKHEIDPGILMIYGHIVAQANHSHSALPYYFRALALQPDNICVNLSIATMWVQNAMKRQTDNRQFGIQQGLAALWRYYDLRVASGKACHLQEAEYNVARMWHHLGLTHLAMPGYEKVLELSAQVHAEAVRDGGAEDQVVEDFAAEAAFALQGLHALAGNDEAARAIGEQWLVI